MKNHCCPRAARPKEDDLLDSMLLKNQFFIRPVKTNNQSKSQTYRPVKFYAVEEPFFILLTN